MPTKQKYIFTLGFEKLTMVEFIRMVKDQDIARVVDIRSENTVMEGRGRFSPEQLADILKNVNVDYIRLPEAGIPLELQSVPKSNGHFTDFCREYTKLISSNKKLLKRINELFPDGNALILSFEANVNVSHRLPFSEIVLSVLGKSYKLRHLDYKDLKPIEIPPQEPPERSK